MKIANELEPEKWNDFLHANPNYSIFHIPEINDFYKQHNNTMPCSVFVLDQGSVKGLALGELTKQAWDFIGITKREIFYSEPIYNGDLEVLNLLLKRIKKNADGVFVQIRNSKIQSDDEKLIYKENGFQFKDHLNALIKLENRDDVWNGFENDKKKGIRKAKEKYGIQIIEKNDMQGIDDFYNLVKKLYRKKNHPLNKINYFMDMFHFLGSKRMRFFFAVLKNEIIATQLALFENNRITALYTATLEEHKKEKAGDLLIWHLINLGFQEGFTYFDFGGAGNPNENYGPREYKKRFGCTFENVGRYNLIRKKITYFIVEKAYRFFLKS